MGSDFSGVFENIGLASGLADTAVANRPLPLAVATLLLIFATYIFTSKILSQVTRSIRMARYPAINPDGWASSAKAKLNFATRAKSLMLEGIGKFSGPFYMATDVGTQLMLPGDYIDAVSAERNLSFERFINSTFMSHLETFASFGGQPGLLATGVFKGITPRLPSFTKPMADETTKVLDQTWGDPKDWKEVTLKDGALVWIARLSSLVFVGPELASNPEWIRLSIDFTTDVFAASDVVKFWPWFLKYFAERFSAQCRKARSHARKAAALLAPILAARDAEIAAAAKEGRDPVLPEDSVEWFRTVAKGQPYHAVNMQLGLGFASIHTTSDLLTQAILNLCKYPEVIPLLREEAVRVLKQFGWRKEALTELRLLDSFLKETQRLKPIFIASMQRLALEDVDLPNGMHLTKGDMIAVPSHRMWDASVYPDPEKFDAARYVKRRKVPGLENNSLLVATSKDHTGFGHGRHACPGRFFAANEVKIIMLHLLLKYDIKIADPSVADWFEFNNTMAANPFAKVSIRRRTEEMDLDHPTC